MVLSVFSGLSVSMSWYTFSFRDYLGAIAGASRDHFVVSSVFLECTDRTTATSGVKSDGPWCHFPDLETTCTRSYTEMAAK